MRHFFSAPALLPVLLCTLLTVAVNAQPIPRSEADSLLRLLGGGKADTNRVNQLIRLGEYQVYKPGEFKADMDSARSYAGQAQALSRQLGFYAGEGRSLNLLGTISRESKALEQSVGYHQAALRLYQQHKDWRGEADSYLLLAWTHRDKGDAPGARTEVQTAIALYKGKGDHRGVGQAYLELGNTYAYWGEELDTRIGHYQQALEWFTKAKDKKKRADVHKDLGDMYGYQGNTARALIELHKALDLYRSVNYLQLQGVYDLLGNNSSEMGDLQEGLYYGLLAVKTAERLKDSTMQLCTIYNRLGITYYRLKQYQKALIYSYKGMFVAQKYNDRSSILILTGNIANALYYLGQPEASLRLLLSTAKRYPPQNIRDSLGLFARLLRNYTQLKQYAVAQRYCNQLLSSSHRLGKNDGEHTIIYNSIIPFLIASKQHGQARKYLAEYEKYCAISKRLQETARTQLWWFQLDSMQANYPSAIRHYQQYKRLEDSLLNETKNRQIANHEVLYETEKKEQDIKLKEQSIKALTRERQMQAKQSEQDKRVRNSLVGGAVLLMALLGVIYNRYRLKRRSNQLLKAQQQQLQAQHEALQTQQMIIHQKNTELVQLVDEKEELLQDKDHLLSGQQQLLEEKERLLKEIHHRVKNNLQVVMSLLNSQAASLADKAALSAIRESQHRVQAMALIHQKLYQAEGLARIPMPDYVTELVSYLRDSYRLTQPVGFRLQVDPLELDVTQAVPLGLILNEAVTNACKYAFPGGRAGTVSVSLKQLPAVEPTTYQLRIEDDGIGLPQGFNPARSRSLGMTLLHGFSRQLGGKLTINSHPGLTISLTFAEEKTNLTRTAYAYQSA